jgi:hypothetical protein
MQEQPEAFASALRLIWGRLPEYAQSP